MHASLKQRHATAMFVRKKKRGKKSRQIGHNSINLVAMKFIGLQKILIDIYIWVGISSKLIMYGQ